MLKTLLTIALALPLTAAAQYRPLETKDEARQRHSAERYETYRSRGNSAPLGGYPERLGDPAPRGTERPGYTTTPYSAPPAYDTNRDRQQDRDTDRLAPRTLTR